MIKGTLEHPHLSSTQYAEGIYDNPVTLKSRSLKVTGNGTIE